jgi:VIT1/CCC1 family predicted Fe2+/Mn2+ transporter
MLLWLDMKPRGADAVIKKSMREIIFGLEDGCVSTLGAVTGIAAGSGNSSTVILAGTVLIVVEAISMAAGSFLSSKAVLEVQGGNRAHSETVSVRAGVVMFFSYLIGGLFPLLPYIFLPVERAPIPSIFFTVLVLFLVGVWKARFVKRGALRSGLEMVFVSMAAAFAGFVVGRFVAGVYEM